MTNENDAGHDAGNETKKRTYKVNDTNGDGESASLKNNAADIEMIELNAGAAESTPRATPSRAGGRGVGGGGGGCQRANNKSSCKCEDVGHRIKNLLDLNLKFNDPGLEKYFKQAYLPVTRLVFIHYLLYLLFFTGAWILYYTISNSIMAADLVAKSKLAANMTAGSGDADAEQKSSMALGLRISSSFVLILLFIVFFAVLLVVFIFVLATDMKESRYRRLEKRVRDEEMETKVNFETAERDLKITMQEVIKKEAEYENIKKELKFKYVSVAKLRALYSKIAHPIGIFIVLYMFVACLVSFACTPSNLNPVGHFIWFCEATVLLYVIYPFEMLVSIVTGLVFSVVFEALAIRKQESVDLDLSTGPQLIIFIFIKIMLHTSVHMLGVYLKLSVQSIKRDTFLKVGHMHKAHMNAQQTKEITERMIKSIMPPLFKHVFGKPEEFKQSVDCEHLMRPLYIYPVSELSILFADIVGFTKMSSTKTAEELVYLLNDLYGRFDKICEITGCEKISTLGDCYYCVSGCLNGRADHAKCCVEMGLMMVKEIETFNRVNKVDVNMRVGVHTGKALCGFIGGKRFRFDVWSSDVTLANKMESSGRAGWVHISEDTFKHLNNQYKTEPGEKYSGKSTYFVLREDKKETVAQVLKQTAVNKELLNSSANMSGGAGAALDVSEAGSKMLLNRSQLDNSAETQPGQQPDDSLISNMGSLQQGDENSQLLLAVKEANFFRPDVNPCTMRFAAEDESQYRAYVIGLNHVTFKERGHIKSLTASEENPVRAAEEGAHLAAAATAPACSPASTAKRAASITHSSKNVWTCPRNSLFFSVLLSFLINIFVSTAYLLSFIVSSMTYPDFKMSSMYKVHFAIIFVVFGLLLVLQVGFLVFNLLQCTTLVRKSATGGGDRKTFLFDAPAVLANAGGGNKSSRDIYNQADMQQHRPSSQQNAKIFANKSMKAFNRHVAVRYHMLHLLATLILSLIPVYIFFTSIPAANCIVAATRASGQSLNLFSMYSYFCFTVSLVHFCSFIQLSSFVKTLVAAVLAVAYAVIGFVGFIKSCESAAAAAAASLNGTDSASVSMSVAAVSCSYYSYYFVLGFFEKNFVIIIDMALLIVLVWIVNRQSELVQRLSFKCDQDANSKVKYAKEQKELADWLIGVVLPNNVIGYVQEKRQYSRNYESVGVLFVSLCNFGEFFEETYEGGRELLRILNEITVDFDRLFDEPKYSNIEKIKSIGSTFMIASGLSAEPASSRDDMSHLYDLIDFAIELNQKLEAFNNEAMSVCHFKFKMRMGFNAGPVTAGVIGTERLLYDIWGDTVNVASRMDSTGEPGQLQLPESVAERLKDTYKFTYRGQVQVKGKDNMITYFMNPKENKQKMSSSN